MISKKDLIEKIHQNSSIRKEVIADIVQQFVEAIRDEIIAGNEVRLYELGTFKVSTRKACKGYNAVDGVHIEIPAVRMPRMKFNVTITKALNS